MAMMARRLNLWAMRVRERVGYFLLWLAVKVLEDDGPEE